MLCLAVNTLACAGEAQWKRLNDQVVPLMTRGSLEHAEQVARQGLAEAEKSFGPDHRNTETSVSNLALVLRLRKRFEESEKHYRRALAWREKSLGAAHPSTALIKLNLADVVQAQRRYVEAEKLQRAVLPVFEKVYGDDPKTAAALNNLGANLQQQKRYGEAEPLLRRALLMKEKVLGVHSQSVANTLVNLAQVCDALGRKAEAERYRARAAEIRAQSSGRALGPSFSGPRHELAVAATGFADRHGGHPRFGRSAMRAHDHRFHIFRTALDERFDAAVETVAHPAGNLELPRLVCHVIAKAHALHAPGDDKVFGDHDWLIARTRTMRAMPDILRRPVA
jgi:tetratricopeptide (TPR) repeat protein